MRPQAGHGSILAMASQKNRRDSGARVRLDVPVRIETGRGTQNGTLRDLSPGGVFVSAQVQPIGTMLKCSFSADGNKIDFEAEVRYHEARGEEGPGMGLRFVRLEGSAAAAIEKIIASRPLVP